MAVRSKMVPSAVLALFRVLTCFSSSSNAANLFKRFDLRGWLTSGSELPAVTAVLLGWDATVVTVMAGLEMAAAEVMFTRGRISATLLAGCRSARVAVGVASPPLSRELLLGEFCLLAAGCGRRSLTLLASSGP